MLRLLWLLAAAALLMMAVPPGAQADRTLSMRAAQLVPTAAPGGAAVPATKTPIARVAPILALVCVIIMSSLAFGLAIGLRRQISAIAGPDPDDDD